MFLSRDFIKRHSPAMRPEAFALKRAAKSANFASAHLIWDLNGHGVLDMISKTTRQEVQSFKEFHDL